MSAIGAWLLKFFTDYILNKIVSAWNAFWKEKDAKKADGATVDQAIEEVRKPGKDPLKTVEQNEKDQETAFDQFRDKLN